ncbi:MAG: carbon-nitrogen hydrolase family protein [Pseudomonadota bacterium]|nr:carbon-nitrogen hydrolase family protein [Pseudomonadota bacterium]
MIVAALELPGRGGTIAERLAQADLAIDAAVATGARLVVLPEAYLPGYSHVRASCAEDALGFLTDRAARHRACLAMGYLAHDACSMALVAPDGRRWTYQKRFLSPAEARVWTAGRVPVIANTPVGRVGLALCADVLQRATWEPFRGAVDIVAVGAAWPDYVGRLAKMPVVTRPALRWLFSQSNPYRDDLLGRAAVAIGAPVVFANAHGNMEGAEGFSGGSGVWSSTGERVARVMDGVASACVSAGTPGSPLGHPPEWEAFTTIYRWAGRYGRR